MPYQLVALVDQHCKDADLTRSQMIGRAVRLYLASKIAKDNVFWIEQYQKAEEAGKL
jgi:hypothetical protein